MWTTAKCGKVTLYAMFKLVKNFFNFCQNLTKIKIIYKFPKLYCVTVRQFLSYQLVKIQRNFQLNVELQTCKVNDLSQQDTVRFLHYV